MGCGCGDITSIARLSLRNSANWSLRWNFGSDSSALERTDDDAILLATESKKHSDRHVHTDRQTDRGGERERHGHEDGMKMGSIERPRTDEVRTYLPSLRCSLPHDYPQLLLRLVVVVMLIIVVWWWWKMFIIMMSLPMVTGLRRWLNLDFFA